MILQLNPAILVETPLGTGEAIFIIDYGMHQNSCWIVALQKDGVIKHFDSNDVILSTNYTYGMNLHKNSLSPNHNNGIKNVNSKHRDKNKKHEKK
ncbi:MAG: hypothetical protein JWN78_3293 [Bacteroidota bacterium]|nr:hypothetical protein [Bacteroidota bacterium]